MYKARKEKSVRFSIEYALACPPDKKAPVFSLRAHVLLSGFLCVAFGLVAADSKLQASRL